MRPAALAEPRNRPFLALGAGLLVLLAMLALPASRAWLGESVGEPLRAQADPERGLAQGYSLPSMAFWAALGGLVAWALYELLFVRLDVAPDRAFFLGLAPFLLFGPLFHALLAADALPRGTFVAYLAAEPLIYLTTGVLAAGGVLAGRLLRRAWVAPAVGAAVLAPVVVLAAPLVAPEAARNVAILLALALVPALAAGYAFTRVRRGESLAAACAVVGAHALDGATTWMVLRDPFGLGFPAFGEKNPVSEALVGLSNGWPYFAVKLALPVVLLGVLRKDDDEPRARAFLLFAVFVLGFGPGMANLMQVLFAR